MKTAASRHPRGRNGKPRKDPADRNIGIVARMERAALQGRSAADRLSDAIARVTGSAGFAVVHFGWFAVWLLVNTGYTRIAPFDPFPFSFLTLIVSLEAIFLSVFVLMSQNRMTRREDKRAHLDLQIDLLAEQELTLILHMLKGVCQKLDVSLDVPSERMRQLLRDTDVHELATKLERHLPD
jgi:uncharacterized membrane protein